MINQAQVLIKFNLKSLIKSKANINSLDQQYKDLQII